MAAIRSLDDESLAAKDLDPWMRMHKPARAVAATDEYATSRRQRKKVEMLFALLKRILRRDRLRLRGPNGAGRVPPRSRRTEPREAPADRPSGDPGLRRHTFIATSG